MKEAAQRNSTCVKWKKIPVRHCRNKKGNRQVLSGVNPTRLKPISKVMVTERGFDVKDLWMEISRERIVYGIL